MCTCSWVVPRRYVSCCRRGDRTRLKQFIFVRRVARTKYHFIKLSSFNTKWIVGEAGKIFSLIFSLWEWKDVKVWNLACFLYSVCFIHAENICLQWHTSDLMEVRLRARVTRSYKGENSFIWDFSVPVIGHGPISRGTKGGNDGLVSKQYYKTTYDI